MTKATFTDQWGYVWVPAPLGHPKATKRNRSKRDGSFGRQNGYVKRCWIVAESKIGRHLFKGESVHHIDGNKSNDEPDNLEVMLSSDHAKLHRSMRNPRQRPGAPSGKGPCVNCNQESNSDRKRGLCNACYLKAKRWRSKNGIWPDFALKFG